ncbi:hypothetical protein [Natrinema halophilum]|uniref:Uncharacterized protein n=1 Tax=Natrinema halophilum TaxID=1699371 RepID=A0A7D5KE12_9EURY|nr:hypothetical protein [Natrinema halophilum]QLG49881.1 hypothetical protein HYG82_13955 [Natrinema halophilum]
MVSGNRFEVWSNDPPYADRCDRPGEAVRGDRVIRVSSEPCPDLADRYRAVSRSYCPDCVAGIGLLAVSTDTMARLPTKTE